MQNQLYLNPELPFKKLVAMVTKVTKGQICDAFDARNHCLWMFYHSTKFHTFIVNRGFYFFCNLSKQTNTEIQVKMACEQSFRRKTTFCVKKVHCLSYKIKVVEVNFSQTVYYFSSHSTFLDKVLCLDVKYAKKQNSQI